MVHRHGKVKVDYEQLGQYYAEKYKWVCDKCGKIFLFRHNAFDHEKICKGTHTRKDWQEKK